MKVLGNCPAAFDMLHFDNPKNQRRAVGIDAFCFPNTPDKSSTALCCPLVAATGLGPESML